jgi:hypothetical protein
MWFQKWLVCSFNDLCLQFATTIDSISAIASLTPTQTSIPPVSSYPGALKLGKVRMDVKSVSPLNSLNCSNSCKFICYLQNLFVLQGKYTSIHHQPGDRIKPATLRRGSTTRSGFFNIKQCKPCIDAQWLACQQASLHSAFTGLRSLPP